MFEFNELQYSWVEGQISTELRKKNTKQAVLYSKDNPEKKKKKRIAFPIKDED